MKATIVKQHKETAFKASITQHDHKAGFSVWTTDIALAFEFSATTLHDTYEAAHQAYGQGMIDWATDHNYEVACGDDECTDCYIYDQTDAYEEMAMYAMEHEADAEY